MAFGMENVFFFHIFVPLESFRDVRIALYKKSIKNIKNK